MHACRSTLEDPTLIRRRFTTIGRVGELLAAWPFAVPGTVFAMALIVSFSRDWRVVFGDRIAFTLALADTAWLLVVAYVAKHVALGSQAATDSLSQQDPSLAEAARVLGASPRRAFLDAVLPLLRPALTTAFLLTFLTCATELTMSVLLVPAGRDLLGTLLFEYQSYSQPSAASVLACAFVLVVIAALALLAGVRRRAR